MSSLHEKDGGQLNEYQGNPQCQDSPKHPEYAVESERLSTFSTWGVQSAETLCKAGFYYTGDKQSYCVDNCVNQSPKNLCYARNYCFVSSVFKGEKDTV